MPIPGKMGYTNTGKWDHPVVHVMHVIIKNIKNAIYFDYMPISVDRLI